MIKIMYTLLGFYFKVGFSWTGDSLAESSKLTGDNVYG